MNMCYDDIIGLIPWHYLVQILPDHGITSSVQCTLPMTCLWKGPSFVRSEQVFNQQISSCMCSLWLNRNITGAGRQFTRCCCKKLLRITVWWLASKVIASRSTSTVFCPKIFWVVIRNAFRNCVSNWKFWKYARWVWLAAAVAKKRFWRSGNSRPVYGPTPYASNTVVSNSQSSNHDVDVGDYN